MLEAICFQTREVLDAMRRDVAAAGSGTGDGGRMELKDLRVDGGASANDLLMQLQADILQARGAAAAGCCSSGRGPRVVGGCWARALLVLPPSGMRNR